MPRVQEALLADAVGTVAGAALGTSTVTAYIESSAGVASGGRTGLAPCRDRAAVPARALLSSAREDDRRRLTPAIRPTLYPIVAPALVLVGVMMMQSVREIRWDDPTDAMPAFLTMIVMPLAMSITDGIAFGFIAFVLLKAATGRAREAHALTWVFAGVFLARYVLGLRDKAQTTLKAMKT